MIMIKIIIKGRKMKKSFLDKLLYIKKNVFLQPKK